MDERIFNHDFSAWVVVFVVWSLKAMIEAFDVENWLRATSVNAKYFIKQPFYMLKAYHTTMGWLVMSW